MAARPTTRRAPQTQAEVAAALQICTVCNRAYLQPCNGANAACGNLAAINGTASFARPQPRTTVAPPTGAAPAKTSEWPKRPAIAPATPLIRSNPEDRRPELATAPAPRPTRRIPADAAVGATVPAIVQPAPKPAKRANLIENWIAATSPSLRVTFANGTEARLSYSRGQLRINSTCRAEPDAETALLNALVGYVTAGLTPAETFEWVLPMVTAARDLTALAAKVAADLAINHPAPAPAPAKAPRKPRAKPFVPGMAVYAAPSDDGDLYPATLVRELANGDWRVRWIDGNMARCARRNIEV